METVGKQAWSAAVVLVGSLSGFEAVSAAAFEADRGRLLYENHCTTCHTSVAHIRAGRKAPSLDEIRKQCCAGPATRTCSGGPGKFPPSWIT